MGLVSCGEDNTGFRDFDPPGIENRFRSNIYLPEFKVKRYFCHVCNEKFGAKSYFDKHFLEQHARFAFNLRSGRRLLLGDEIMLMDEEWNDCEIVLSGVQNSDVQLELEGNPVQNLRFTVDRQSLPLRDLGHTRQLDNTLFIRYGKTEHKIKLFRSNEQRPQPHSQSITSVDLPNIRDIFNSLIQADRPTANDFFQTYQAIDRGEYPAEVRDLLWGIYYYFDGKYVDALSLFRIVPLPLGAVYKALMHFRLTAYRRAIATADEYWQVSSATERYWLSLISLVSHYLWVERIAPIEGQAGHTDVPSQAHEQGQPFLLLSDDMFLLLALRYHIVGEHQEAYRYICTINSSADRHQREQVFISSARIHRDMGIDETARQMYQEILHYNCTRYIEEAKEYLGLSRRN